MDIDLSLGSKYPLLTLTLTQEELKLENCSEAMNLADLIELRISDGPITNELVSLCTKPVLFRLNSSKDIFLSQMASPWMIDLPYKSENLAQEIELCRKKFPNSSVQISYHSPNETENSGDLVAIEPLIESMAQFSVDAIKCALYLASLDHVLTILQLIRKQKGWWGEKRLTLIIMSERFSFSRILGHCFGNFLTFLSLPNRQKALGQIDIISCLEDYQLKNISLFSSFYALIGSPVERSLSHRSHTRIFHEIFNKASSVYVKIDLSPDEFTKDIVEKMRSLSLQGLSITTPLKRRSALLYAEDATPINTIAFSKKGVAQLKNSDIEALKKAIDQRVPFASLRSIAILGYGDVALSLVDMLFFDSPHIDIYTRDRKKTGNLRDNTRCIEYSIAASITSYDMIINATSDRDGLSLLSLFPVQEISKTALVAEFVYPEESIWFQKIKEERKESRKSMISGRELWIKQAAKQFLFWIPSIAISEEMIEERLGEIIGL